MNQIIGKFKDIQEIFFIFALVLLVSFHFNFVYFMNSTYLKEVFSDHTVGYLYTIGSLLNILLFLGVPYYLRKKGNYKMTLWLVILEILALVGLAFVSNPGLIVALFVLHSAIIPLIYYATDIFLERYNNPSEIGSLRGVYLTMQNLPPIITPFIIGIILIAPSSYWIVYLIATAFLVPFLLILFTYFRDFKDQEYYILDTKKTLVNFYHKNNIYDVFVDRFLLNLFFSVSIIYLPIYLADYIGFHWDSIGIIFSIMLLPFILFQIPIGNLEDKYHDEKYILVVGFYIMAATFIILPFLQEASIVIWAVLLFVSRIGASFVEVASESYFFKHIHPDNAGYIGLFRMTRTLPYLISPLLLTIAVTFFDFKYVFMITGILMLFGVRYTLRITEDKDPERPIGDTIPLSKQVENHIGPEGYITEA